LTNPASPTTCVIGVGREETAKLMVETLRLQGVKAAMVVLGDKGLDEVGTPTFVISLRLNNTKTLKTTTKQISPEGATQVWDLKDGEVSHRQVSSRDFGLTPFPLESVTGGDPHTNLGILKGLLDNVQSEYLDWVVMNTSALLVVNGKAASFEEGVSLARLAVSSGKAREVFDQFVHLTTQFHQKRPKTE